MPSGQESTKAKQAIPPQDTNGELERATLALRRIRRELTEKANLSLDWQHWLAQSLLNGLPPLEDVVG